MTTTESLTVKQILDLQAEARERGAGLLAAYCELALVHDRDAVRIVVDAINAGEGPAETCGCRDGCQNAPEEPHSCPYASEINGDDEMLCTCCDACQRECSDDI